MNDRCFMNCAFKELCNLDKENTEKCKVALDESAQKTARETTFGYKTEDLLKKQYR